MPWVPDAFSGGVIWQDKPSIATALDAANLNLEEQLEAAYAVALSQSVVNYFEGGANPVRFVSAAFGSDSANGKSIGTAQQTVAHAIADLPNGGRIVVLPGSYIETAQWNLNGHHIEGVPLTNSPNTYYGAVIFKGGATAWDGPLVNFVKGGSIKGLTLNAPNVKQHGQLTAAPTVGQTVLTLNGSAGSAAILAAAAVGDYLALDAPGTLGGSLLEHVKVTAVNVPASQITVTPVQWAHAHVGNVTATTIPNEVHVASLYKGAAIQGISTTATRSGYIALEDVECDANWGWERALLLDGSGDATSGGPGIRDIFTRGLRLFGSYTFNESVVVKRAIHAFFNGLEVIPAPCNTMQGVKVLDAQSEGVFFTDAWVEGTLEVEAAGNAGGASTRGVLFEGWVQPPAWAGTNQLAASVLFDAAADGNRIIGPVDTDGTHPAIVNSGSARNVADLLVWQSPTFSGATPWSALGGGIQAPGFAIDPHGEVKLRGSITNAVAAGYTSGYTIMTLPAGYRPPNQITFYFPALASASLQTIRVDVTTAGAVVLQTTFSGGPATISLNAIRFFTY